MPSVCLYKIEEISNKQKVSNLFNNNAVISGEPTFRINGADMFLDSGTKHEDGTIHKIRFLTNHRNMRAEILTPDHYTDEQIDFARLISPSLVVTISLKQLKTLQKVQLSSR